VSYRPEQYSCSILLLVNNAEYNNYYKRKSAYCKNYAASFHAGHEVVKLIDARVMVAGIIVTSELHFKQ